MLSTNSGSLGLIWKTFTTVVSVQVKKVVLLTSQSYILYTETLSVTDGEGGY